LVIGNPLVGSVVEADVTDSAQYQEFIPASETGDGTEWAVAAFAIGALALLVLFRAVGFTTVVAVRAG
jgi:hypothetical protein